VGRKRENLGKVVKRHQGVQIRALPIKRLKKRHGGIRKQVDKGMERGRGYYHPRGKSKVYSPAVQLCDREPENNPKSDCPKRWGKDTESFRFRNRTGLGKRVSLDEISNVSRVDLDLGEEEKWGKGK